ncbi:MAG TPA: hypothetical protein VMD48_14095 [Solirubrobacteraceae bacterium]|nr:hypothetical protein [Solirubrobacteraceae bacterium]
MSEQEELEELIEYLERDQLVADRSVPVPPARLSRPAAIGLWALRVFAIILSAMVIYVFIAQL